MGWPNESDCVDNELSVFRCINGLRHNWDKRATCRPEYLGDIDGEQQHGKLYHGAFHGDWFQVARRGINGGSGHWSRQGRLFELSFQGNVKHELGYDYAAMRFAFLFLLCPVLAFGQAFSFQDLPFLANAGGTDWERRVVANGGAQPSANTVLAMETLRLGCIAAGLTNKIHSLCVFVPDSLIAATTPLFKHKGSDPWTNVNFGTTNLDINGLKGDGATKSLDTGVKAKDVVIPASGSTIGMTVIVTESATNASEITIGQQNDDDSRIFALTISSGGFTQWYPARTATGEGVLTNDFGRVGYVSGSRNTNGGSTNLTIFVASPLESHKIITNLGGSIQALTTTTDETISAFANKHGSTNRQWSFQKMSLAMVNDGFTESESSNFWNLAKACRETLGGGTGDPIHDYNRKIVAAGGAAISTTTSNSLRTFYSGLNTDGTLYLMSVVNAIVPDNLTAARTPVIWQTGSEIWTNINFGTTNLSVSGLQGNGTDKYLGTGIIPAHSNRISTTSAAISGLISANPGTTLTIVLAGNPVTANVSTLLSGNLGGLTSFRLWRNDLINQNFLQAADPSPGATYIGWLSGNRTAANAIAVYIANTGLAHSVFTNATGAQTGTALSNTRDMFAFANNNNGVVAAPGAHTMSFVAWHGGMTQTQNSNLYARVHILRTALGGGSP